MKLSGAIGLLRWGFREDLGRRCLAQNLERRTDVISRAPTKSKTGERRQLMVLAKRAFLHDDALAETYVKPPHLRDTERCLRLTKWMYGTFPAAAGWQQHVQKVGAHIGLFSPSNCPRVFGHATRDLDMVVHGS